MEIKYSLEEDDYISFNLYHIQNSLSQKWILNMLRFVVPPLGGLIIYYFGTRQFKQPNIYWMITAILFVVLWIIFYPSRHEKSIRKQVEKMLSEGDNSSFFGEKTLILNEDNIEILGESTSEKFLRNNAKDVRIYDNIIAVYLSTTNAHIIPTRYLDDEAKKFLMNYFSIQIIS